MKEEEEGGGSERNREERKMDGWRDGGRLQTKFEEGEEERRRDVRWWDPAPPQGGGATAQKVCGFGFEEQMKEKQKEDSRASCGRHGDGGLTCPHRGAFVPSSRPLTPPRRRHNGAPSLAHVRAHAGPLGSNPPTVSCRLPPPPSFLSSPSCVESRRCASGGGSHDLGSRSPFSPCFVQRARSPALRWPPQAEELNNHLHNGPVLSTPDLLPVANQQRRGH